MLPKHQRALALTAGVLALAALGWLVADALRSRAAAPSAAAVAGAPAARTPPGNLAVQEGVRKCRTRRGIEYTTSPCPPGSTEQAIDKGSVTVVDLPRPGVADRVGDALTPSGQTLPNKPLPNARDLLVPPEPGPSLREQRIDAVVNQTAPR